jgi:anti-sigma B factor antagonist
MPELGDDARAPAVNVEGGELSITGRVEADGTLWLQLFGEFDLAAADAFTEVVALPEAKSRPTVIDLSGLDFLDSTGVLCLLRASSQAELRRQELRFTRGTGKVARILELTGVEQLLRYVD